MKRGSRPVEIVGHERRYACSDELIIRNAPYTEYGPHLFLPVRMSIKWARMAGTVWRPLAIIVEGPHAIVEDGKVRLSKTERHNRSFEPDTAPEWLQDLAAGLVPPVGG